MNTIRTICAALVVVSSSMTMANESAKSKPATWILAAAKHNGSGLELRYDAPARLQVGESATVRLHLSGVRADDARVEVRAGEGLRLLSPVAAALPRGQETSIDVTVAATTDGVHYLDVFTSQNGRRSAQSVPVTVGTGVVRLKRSGTAATTPSGEKIISLPSAQ